AAPGPTAFLSGHPETGIGGARVFCESSVTVFRFRGRFVGGSARLTSASSIRVCRSSGPSTTAVALVLLRRPRGAHDLDVLAHLIGIQPRRGPRLRHPFDLATIRDLPAAVWCLPLSTDTRIHGAPTQVMYVRSSHGIDVQ